MVNVSRKYMVKRQASFIYSLIVLRNGSDDYTSSSGDFRADEISFALSAKNLTNHMT